MSSVNQGKRATRWRVKSTTRRSTCPRSPAAQIKWLVMDGVLRSLPREYLKYGATRRSPIQSKLAFKGPLNTKGSLSHANRGEARIHTHLLALCARGPA